MLCRNKFRILQYHNLTSVYIPDVSFFDITFRTTTFQDIKGLPMTNFTPEDLLLYLYKETTPLQTKAIEKALKKDWTLREKMTVLKTSMQRLDKLKETPRTEVVLNVLNYAREKSSQAV
jgi:hypothetical protein